MSIQANYCVELLMQFYAELDQRSGWAGREALIASQSRKGIAVGRTETALNSLRDLKMLDERTSEGEVELKISAYGVDWVEHHFTLTSRGANYEYEWSPFRKIRLVGPDVFYRQRSKSTHAGNGANWTKWGAIGTLVSILVAVVLWWLT